MRINCTVYTGVFNKGSITCLHNVKYNKSIYDIINDYINHNKHVNALIWYCMHVIIVDQATTTPRPPS